MRNKHSKLKRELPLHLMILPGVIALFVFSYIPLYGIFIAFQNFNPRACLVITPGLAWETLPMFSLCPTQGVSLPTR